MKVDGLIAAREATLALVEGLDDDALSAQPHPDLSPIGWHLGHIAFTEAHWILGRCAGDDSRSEPYAHRWAQGALPKHERVHQPSREELLAYLAEVRERVLEVLPDLRGDDPLLKDDFVAWLIEAHEHQHRETIAMVRQLALEQPGGEVSSHSLEGPVGGEYEFERTTASLGTDDRRAYDNERPRHDVELAPFAIDTTPVTVAAWQSFRNDRGYQRREFWSDAGWAWRCANENIRAPRGWTASLARARLDGTVAPLDPREPVSGISWYEADAFARWRGARLPTEAEWEHAARSIPTIDPHLLSVAPRPISSPDFIGNVWEWTATAFAPYPGFEAFPYRGYSEPYFDRRHFVLRGGSFATHPAIARVTFRNWYEPHTRYLFSGLRCARSL